MGIKKGVFKWDIAEIAKALKIKQTDVRLYFTDGRRISFMLERRLAYEILKGRLAPSEGAGYDLIDTKGGKWEVRSISKGGIYFSPSYMVGSGRSFNKKGFLKKLKEIKGYIISDIESFPKIPFWIIPVELVIQWWKEGKLGTTTKISRQTALNLIDTISNNG
ncbi:MAG: hypothetical protein HZB65_03920 [Candidatus Aenigmarchaeota archaeon]|nr:hypothetical protein [Candidatus Aenigmarchaeota archaeon]